MTTHPGAALASAAIIGYQRYLSPYKGFRCAHCVLHRGLSCSEAVRRLFLKHGLIAGWPLMRARFAECKQAARTLRAQRAFAMAQAAQGEAGSGKKKSSADCGGDCLPDLGGCDLPCDCDCGF